MKVKKTDYGNSKTILKYLDEFTGVARMVSDEGIATNSEGKKIVPAGSLLGSADGGDLVAMNDESTEGVLLSDVDVTYGKAVGTIVIHGVIDKTKIPVQPTVEAIATLRLVEFV